MLCMQSQSVIAVGMRNLTQLFSWSVVHMSSVWTVPPSWFSPHKSNKQGKTFAHWSNVNSSVMDLDWKCWLSSRYSKTLHVSTHEVGWFHLCYYLTSWLRGVSVVNPLWLPLHFHKQWTISRLYARGTQYNKPNLKNLKNHQCGGASDATRPPSLCSPAILCGCTRASVSSSLSAPPSRSDLEWGDRGTLQTHTDTHTLIHTPSFVSPLTGQV